MNYFKTEKRTAFIAVLLIFVIFLPFSVHSAHADDTETPALNRMDLSFMM